MTVYGKKERRLAQCRFPGLAISNAKILIYSSNKIYGCNFIKQHSQTDCSLKTNFIVSLIIIFGTLSFVFKSVLGRPGEQSPNNLWAQSLEKHFSGFPGNVFHEAMSRAPITEHQFT